MIFPGGATDPNSGPLLILLALAYWPPRSSPGHRFGASAADVTAVGRPHGGGLTMAHPTWLAYGFAVLMVSVSVYCIGRLVWLGAGRRNHCAVNISHVLMGVAMVGMLVPRWNVLPDGLWEVVFGIIAAVLPGHRCPLCPSGTAWPGPTTTMCTTFRIT